MPRIENLIVEGQGLVVCGHDANSLIKLKNAIIENMRSRNYFLMTDAFLTLQFIANISDTEVPPLLKLGKFFGLVTRKDIEDKQYELGVYNKSYEVPFLVTFCLTPQKNNGEERFLVDLSSEPAIRYKIRNLNMKISLDETKYRNIWETNKRFLRETFIGLNIQITKEPKVLDEKICLEIIIPPSLENKLKADFKQELEDLKLVYGKSGNCTAFILRRIIEKALFLSFARNGLAKKIEDFSQPNKLKFLSSIINIAGQEKIGNKPILNYKTSEEISKIKFLGDNAAHNFNANIDMTQIGLNMSSLIIALEELSSHFGK